MCVCASWCVCVYVSELVCVSVWGRGAVGGEEREEKGEDPIRQHYARSSVARYSISNPIDLRGLGVFRTQTAAIAQLPTAWINMD